MGINKLLISGACERKGGYELGDGKYYEKGILVELDLSSGKYDEVYSLSESGPNYPDEHPNLQFTAGCIQGDTMWLPTDTEIHEIYLPDRALKRVISHSCFQNLHSVHRFGDQIVATSTGLDNVVFMDASSGEINNVVNCEGKEPWHRFDVDVDYRQVHSTRPHDCHPNYVFEWQDSLWVTRCRQEDAVNLTNFRQKLEITGGHVTSIHDGVVWNEKLIFTRVDGLLVFFDKDTAQPTELQDPFHGKRNRPIGWCRGLFIDDGIAYLGYSRIRKTRMKDRLKYLAKRNIKYSTSSNALIVAYDIANQKLLKVYETPPNMIDAIYGVMGAVRD